MENIKIDENCNEPINYINRIRKAETPEELNHASLGRIFHHFIHSERNSFAIITYYQTVLSGEEKTEGSPVDFQSRNKEACKKFLEMLRDLKLGFFKLIGHFLKEEEGFGKDYKTDKGCETEEVTALREPFYFIPGITLKQTEKLMKEFCQNGFLYSGPESEGKLWLVTDKGREGEWNEFEPSKVAEFYSTIKGQKIIFEGIPWSVYEGIFTQPLSSCARIPGIKRWQETNVEGGDAFFNR